MVLALAAAPFQGLGSRFAICRPGPYGTRQWLFRPFGPVELSTSYGPNKCHLATISKVSTTSFCSWRRVSLWLQATESRPCHYNA